MKKTRAERLAAVANRRQTGFIVVLEDIHDPHNAAAILRSCDGFGIQEVWFVFANVEPYNPRKIGKSSSSSANKWLDFRFFTSIDDAYIELKRNQYHIIATALTDTAVSPYETNFTHDRIALVVGNEHQGLSAKAIDGSDTVACIPMQGFVQSFNVSVTAALMLAEITRQRRNLRRQFTNTPSTAQKLTARWIDGMQE